MTVLGVERLQKSMAKHADLRRPGAAWLKLAREQSWRDIAHLKETWPAADFVDGETVFNVKGNRYRLWALVNYEAQTMIITRVETHAEYSKRKR